MKTISFLFVLVCIVCSLTNCQPEAALEEITVSTNEAGELLITITDAHIAKFKNLDYCEMHPETCMKESSNIVAALKELWRDPKILDINDDGNTTYVAVIDDDIKLAGRAMHLCKILRSHDIENHRLRIIDMAHEFRSASDSPKLNDFKCKQDN